MCRRWRTMPGQRILQRPLPALRNRIENLYGSTTTVQSFLRINLDKRPWRNRDQG